MLHVDPKQRYKACDVLSHPFIVSRELLPDKMLDHEMDASVIKENVGRVFKALNTQTPLNLESVLESKLARRRAQNRNGSTSSK